MATAQPTTNHDEIRSWVEARNGRPARVKATGEGNDPGILRIDFPGFSGEDTLEEIEWDEFFDWFDRNGLALLLSDEEGNRFNKIVSRETASAGTSSTKKRAASRKSSGAKTSKKAASTSKKGATSKRRATTAKKASSKKTTTRKKTTTKKTTTKKATTKKATTKKASSRSSARTASSKRPASTRKASATSTKGRTTSKKAATSSRKASSKKSTAKKSTTRKSATKKSPAKKSATKKPTTKKSTKSRAVVAVRSVIGGSRKGSGKSSSRQGSKASSRRGSGSSVTTTDRNEIRRWVEARGGFPAHVKKTGARKGDLGVLRIDYPGYSGKDTLERVDWDAWFRAFDKNKLAFLYQDKRNSRFSKLVAR